MKVFNIKFHINLSNGRYKRTDIWTAKRTYMTKVIGAFRKYEQND